MENNLVKIIPDLKINVNQSDLSVSIIDSDQTGDTSRKGNYRSLGLKFLKETIREANYQRKILPEELIEITSFIRMRKILKLISKVCLIYFLPPIKRRFDNSLKNLNLLKEDIEKGISNSYVNIRFNLGDISRKEYEKVQNSFNNLLKTHIVWRITSTSEVDQVKERSSASSAITRVPTEISLDQLVGIRCETKAFLLKSNRGIKMSRNIFIYPGFLVISFSENQFEIVELSKMELTFDISNFLENDFKPKDSEVIGKEWLYQNKDGTRDFRFAGNREIPLVRYGKIYLSNKKDFSAEYMFSNAEYARNFYLNLKSFIDSIN